MVSSRQRSKRCKELEDNIKELRERWLEVRKNLNDLVGPEKCDPVVSEKCDPVVSEKSENLKQPTRALTRRESSRRSLAFLCKEEIKGMDLMTKPAQESERELYEKVILKPMDMSTIRKRYGGEVEDPYAVMNDLLLMFQNATMFYPPSHQTHKTAIELRDKLVPQWEKALLDRFKLK